MFLPLSDRNKLKTMRVPSATLSLIVLNCVIFVIELAVPKGGDIFLDAFAFVPAELFAHAPHTGNLWHLPPQLTLVSYGFLHGNFWHLAVNMLFLWTFADNVEDALGHWRFVAFYLVCGALSALVYGWWSADPLAPFLGASGAVSACVGAYVMLYPRARIWILLFMRIPLPLPAFAVAILWVATQLLFFALGTEPNVGWSAHLAGFASGALLVTILRRKGFPLFRSPTEAAPPAPLLD